MKATAEYVGYFIDDNGNKVYGVLFDPNVPDKLKGLVLDKNNKKLNPSNTASIFNAGKNLRQFVKSDFDNALFFPMLVYIILILVLLISQVVRVDTGHQQVILLTIMLQHSCHR